MNRAPFSSDGCSLWPDGNYGGCCVAHDYAYWLGGSAADRKRADQRLASCVEQRAGRFMAALMYAGVRVGGLPLWPTPFRWNYGYPYLAVVRRMWAERTLYPTIEDEEFDRYLAASLGRRCRSCGCTETTACWNEADGACWWVEDDLCSHCSAEK